MAVGVVAWAVGTERVVIIASRRYDAVMTKVRTTLTIDEDVLKWVKIRAARTGVSDSAVIEEALRRDLKLDVLDELWGSATLSEAKASELAVEAQHATRPRKRGSGARRR